MPGVAFLLATMLTSCLKDKNTNQATQPTSVMAFIDVSPDAPSLDLYQNGNIANTSAISYGSGLSYFTTYTGNVKTAVYTTGSSTSLATDTLTLLANHYYSLFLANTIAKPDFILLADTLSTPANAQAQIRFLNASASAGSVDLVIKGSVLTGNKAYKGYSSFLAVAPSLNDTLVVRKAGTSTVLATLPGVYLNSNNDYTVWLYGGTSTTAGTLAIGVMTNASF